MQRIFEDVLDGRVFEDVKEFAEWIGKRARWLGHECTNAFKMFECIVAEIERTN